MLVIGQTRQDNMRSVMGAKPQKALIINNLRDWLNDNKTHKQTGHFVPCRDIAFKFADAVWMILLYLNRVQNC